MSLCGKQVSVQVVVQALTESGTRQRSFSVGLKRTAKNALSRWGLEGAEGCTSFVKRFEGTPSGKQRKL